MPLGIGRASEYAGWWTGKPKMIGEVTTTSLVDNPWLVTPRYYQDNSATGYSSTVANYGSITSASGGTIDTSGLSNTAGYTTAITIRFGTNYMVSAPSNTAGAGWYDRFVSAGTTYYPKISFDKDYAGGYAVSLSVPSDEQVSSPVATFNSWRGSWLTFVASVSTSSSSFANWTGGTGTYYVRMAMYNTTTGILLQTIQDSAVNGTAITKDFSQTWTMNYAGSYNYLPFWYRGYNADWDQYNQTDFDVASIWHGWAAIDPSVYYLQLGGSAIGPTVNGITATCLLEFNGAGTRNTPNDNGFSITFGPNGQRLPNDALYSVSTGQATSTNSSTLVSF